MKEYVLIYDLPRNHKALQMRVLRALHNFETKRLQHSVWKSIDLSELIRIATFIKKSGGNATILEEKLIF